MKRIVWIILLLLSGHGTFFGQQRRVIIEWFDAQSGLPVAEVTVRCGKSVVRGTPAGRMELWASSGDSIKAQRMGYKTLVWCVPGEVKEVYRIALEAVSTPLREVEVNAENRPDTLIASPVWMVSDFAFWGDGMVILSWTRNREHVHIRWFSPEGKERCAQAIPGNTIGFHEAPGGEIYIEGREHIYRVQDCWLQAIETEVYLSTLRRLVAITDTQYVFSTWTARSPEFAYIRWAKSTTKIDTLHAVRDLWQFQQYYSEYTFLPFATKCEINRRCRRSGEDRYVVAAEMTGFTQTMWWKPLYAPLQHWGNQIRIFDPYRSAVLQWSAMDYRSDTLPILKSPDFKGEIVFDPVDGAAWALLHKAGRTHIYNIDSNFSQPLYYRYTENVKVHDGAIYYLYRPFESSQNTYLYREWIRPSN